MTDVDNTVTDVGYGDWTLDQRGVPIGELVSSEGWRDVFNRFTNELETENKNVWFEHPKNRPVKPIGPKTRLYAIIQHEPKQLQVGDRVLTEPFFSINDAITYHRETGPIISRYDELSICAVNIVEPFNDKKIFSSIHYCVVREIVTVSKILKLIRKWELQDEEQKRNDNYFMMKYGTLSDTNYSFIKNCSKGIDIYAPIYDPMCNRLENGMVLRDFNGYKTKTRALNVVGERPHYGIIKTQAMDVSIDAHWDGSMKINYAVFLTLN